MRNLVPTSDDFAGSPVPVPDDGNNVTADAAGAGDGPNNQEVQGLLNKIWSIVSGKVLFRALAVGLNPGAPANPGNGTISAFGNIASTTGDISAGQDLVAARDVQAGGVVNGASHRTTDANGTMIATGPRVAFTGVTDGAGGGNYQGTDPITNELRPSLITKAWAVARTNDGGFPGRFVKRVNMLGCTIVGGGANPSEVQFVMASAMDSAEYVVLPTIMVYATRVQVPWTKITRTSATTFKIEAAVDFAAVNYEVDVIVHGIQP